MSNKVYEIITENILDMLDKGVAPWKMPWKTEVTKSVHGRPYRGVNVFLLQYHAQLHGYTSPFWVTFKQASKMGGRVIKGSKSAVIVFWKFREVKEKDAESGEEKVTKIPMLRYYRVFNTDAVEGAEWTGEVKKYYEDVEAADGAEETTVREADLEMAQGIVDGYYGSEGAPKFGHGGQQAYYSPVKDEVMIPPQKLFKAGEGGMQGYYSTVFHESGHSTGHQSRLNRDLKAGVFDKQEYSKEELVAEFCAAYLCGLTGVEGVIENQAAYIKGWRKFLEDPKNIKAVVCAAGAGQRAADYILKAAGYVEEDEDGKPELVLEGKEVA